MNLPEFLQTVITTDGPGFFCLSVKTSDGKNWYEEWFKWPDELAGICDRAAALRETANVYFSAHLFATAKSTKENVLPTQTIQADLDEADTTNISPRPTILVQTSPHRHQGYWLLSDQVSTETLELLSRKLTYSIINSDHSGWSLGHKVRLPTTLNFKYLEGPKPVEVVEANNNKYASSLIELLPDINIDTIAADDDWLARLPITLDIGPNELLETLKDKLGKLYTQYNVQVKDRSKYLWSFECTLFRIGCTRDQVYWLAKNSANNKYDRVRFNGDRDLGKEILKAEAVTRNRTEDIRVQILEARKIPGITTIKRQIIADLVLEAMKQAGTFIRTTDDNIWYIRRDLGRPIIITTHSDYLNMILDLQFGLNATEIEQTYVVNALASYTRNLPITATTGALCHYDAEQNHVILHTGRKNILRITASTIEAGTNGSYGVVYPWITSNDPFDPDLKSNIDWGYELFDNALNNIIGIEKCDAIALLKVWTLFIVFRNSAISRPILAFLGQPGSGKSTLFKRIYTLLYGRTRSLGSVTTPDDYDHAVSVDPLTVLDNVDSSPFWLPDRLALGASTSDIIKRKLYTDVDTITLKRQALLGITAHNPKFGREDVTDRFLLINFVRLPNFLPEGDIIDRLGSLRNSIWGSIIKDIQKVLRTANPTAAEVPQFRIEDFARVGYRIATALNVQYEFSGALKAVYAGQKAFSLEEEQLLVTSISNMLRRSKVNGTWKTASMLWTDLEQCSNDAQSFFKTYRNPVNLGKKLWALQDSLKEVFAIENKFESSNKTRVWRIAEKDA